MHMMMLEMTMMMIAATIMMMMMIHLRFSALHPSISATALLKTTDWTTTMTQTPGDIHF